MQGSVFQAEVRLCEEVSDLQKSAELLAGSSFHGQLDFYNRLQAIMLELGFDKDGFEVASPKTLASYDAKTVRSIHATVTGLFGKVTEILGTREEVWVLQNSDLHANDRIKARKGMRQEIAIRFKRTDFADLSRREIGKKLQSSFSTIYRKVQKLAKNIDVRDSGHSAFSHFYEVARIALEELPWATYEVILAALWHDLLEDLGGEFITEDDIIELFGPKVASMIKKMTKHKLPHYLVGEEKAAYESLPTKEEKRLFIAYRSKRLKNLREIDYFGKLDTYDDETLLAKFADRIANLRSLGDCEPEKMLRICEQTIRYFLPVAITRCPTAFILMMNELHLIDSRNDLELHINPIYYRNYSKIRTGLSEAQPFLAEINPADWAMAHPIVLWRSRIPLEIPYRLNEVLCERNLRIASRAMSEIENDKNPA